MAGHGHRPQNGASSGHAPSMLPPPPQSQLRPFTLDEALPYTPFTSIIPFESAEIIPTPTLGSGISSGTLSNIVSSEDFATLNIEAASGNFSRRLEQTLEQVQYLLNPGRITQFKFKTRPQPHSIPGPGPAPKIAKGLSPFSKLVYDKTSIGYKYPDCEEEKEPSQPSQSNGRLKSPPPVKHQQQQQQPKQQTRPETPSSRKPDVSQMPSKKARPSSQPKTPNMHTTARLEGLPNVSPTAAVKQAPAPTIKKAPKAPKAPNVPMAPKVPKLEAPRPIPAAPPPTITPVPVPGPRPVIAPPPVAAPRATTAAPPIVPPGVTAPPPATTTAPDRAPPPAVVLPTVLIPPTKTPPAVTAAPAAVSRPTTPHSTAPAPAAPLAPPPQTPTIHKPQPGPKPEKAQLKASSQAATFVAPAKPAPEFVTPPKPSRPTASDSTPASTTPQTTPATRTPKRLEVALPKPSIKTDDYDEVEYVPEIPKRLSSRRDDRDDPDILGEGLDMGQRAQKALRELRKCFQEIFRFDSLLKAGQPVPPHIVTVTADAHTTLSAESLKKARTLMQSTIDLKCFRSIPIDELVRIQRLCDGGLRQGSVVEVKVNSSWGESDLITWVRQLPNVEFGLRAARTTLCVMSGGRQDKQLYSEDTIQLCVQLFRNVLDGVIVPIAEMRSSTPMFKVFSQQKKAIVSLLTNTEKLLASLSTLMASMELSDMVVNSLEDCASKLVFVENAHNEKDSVIAIQKFDGLRLVAMDLLCQVFQKNPQQRLGILNSILSSLEKLPLTKSSARHFKLADGGSIQPVSALLMRLVQASSGYLDGSAGQYGAQGPGDEDGSDEEGQTRKSKTKSRFTINSENQAALNPRAAINELQTVVGSLHNASYENATYVCNFLIARAKQSTKTGDSPYRSLLEMFVDDFTTCLDNPSWPAASMLLRIMLTMSLSIAQGEKAPSGTKSSVSAINMALELMGIMGASMARLRSHVQKTAQSPDVADSDELYNFLIDLAESVLEDRGSLDLLTDWSGPYRAVVEYLEQRCSTDPHIGGAVSFVVLDWAKNALRVCKADDEDTARFAQLAYRLRMIMMNRRWVVSEFNFAQVTALHAKLSYAIMVTQSDLFTLYSPILQIFFQSMSREEVTVRSKSLKSITHLIETDPTILDGKADFYTRILEDGLGDPSPQVRESALGLISTCLTLRPQYKAVTRPAVLERLTDTSIGVRKRSMKLARDLYMGSGDQKIRTDICSTLLIRLQDQEDSVRDLARQLVEDIWITPFVNAAPSAAAQTSMGSHVALVVRSLNSAKATVGEQVILTLVKGIIGPEHKTDSPSLKVCVRLVAGMFDLVANSTSDDPVIPSGPEALQVLVVFAKAAQSLFTFEQIRSLRPYIETIPQLEDQATSIAALHIYRRVVPTLGTIHKQFLEETRMKLMQFLLKGITAQVLDEMVACLWAIGHLLESTTPMASLMSSSLKGALKTAQAAAWKPATLSVYARYCLIIGTGAKYGEEELEKQKEIYSRTLGKPIPLTVSKFIIDALIPFARPSNARPKEVRKASLEAVALVCQANPKNYVSANVYTTFQEAFKEQNQQLEGLVLSSFLAFLSGEEKRTSLAGESTDAKTKKEEKRELTVMGGTTYDDVASATTQRFLQEITRICLQDVSPHSKLALEVLGTINRQGLVHPKETGVTLITLETCPLSLISELATKEHKLLHDKHEQVLEREYAKAIQSAFNYQRDIIKDSRGARPKPDGTFEPKLWPMMDVLKVSRSKNRQKFLEKLIRLVDFDPSKTKLVAKDSEHVRYSQFVLENLAFFDYTTLGEVTHTVAILEKLFYSTGSTLAQSIEADVFQVRMDVVTTSQVGGEAAPPPPPVDPTKLRHLTSGAMILSSLYEVRTYLRRLWGLGIMNRKESKAKMMSKDLSKAPVKMGGVTGDKLWEDMAKIASSLDSQNQMIAQCRQFVELMTIDSEVKVGGDGQEDEGAEGAEAGTESGDDGGSEVPQARGRKRKAAGPAMPGGRKKRARSSSKSGAKGRAKKNARIGEEVMDHDMVDF